YNKVNFIGSEIPATYELAQNYPNPFNPSTKIRYQIPNDGFVTLKIYDILGAEVSTLVNETKVAGKYEVNFDASSLASGVYIYKLTAGSFTSSKKLMVIK
ncbi:MAG: T9SS type A sorting domain-containing protein, partial [Ignavibacterium sp.]|uniref:T9SS type A sorting domain-containing protein n=1 Tax=Ignavibacterium sp. TaxID=2651167 RepID=UPI00329A2ED9